MEVCSNFGSMPDMQNESNVVLMKATKEELETLIPDPTKGAMVVDIIRWAMNQVVSDDPKQRKKWCKPVSTPSFPVFADEEEREDLEAKPEKAPAVRPSAATERSVHLVPLIVVLCFVVLFLCSHVPSPSDMSSFRGKAGGRKPKLL
ncbi:hypothetical protein VPH35_023259 [Triticum aestivum]